MRVFEGERVPIKAWVDGVYYNKNMVDLTTGVYIEAEALQQAKNISTLPFVFKHVALMPDVHAGKGSTVGSVVATKKAIVPAMVGVDIGCVDKDTEFLSPSGWVKISEWNQNLVMQFDPHTGNSQFIKPLGFIKLPCDKFYHIKTKYGVDQMLSEEHKVLYYKYDRSYSFIKYGTISARELYEKHTSLKNGFRGRFLTSFTPLISTKIHNLTNEQLRVSVMVAADGHIRNTNTNNCILSLKKERKINRAKQLLDNANIKYSEWLNGEITLISFTAPISNKILNYWQASLEQLQIIVDEVFYWDGNEKDQVFFTRDKESADFINYAITACGYRSVICTDLDEDGKIDYRVFKHNNIKIGINGSPKTEINIVKSEDGFKYCFTVPSGFFVIRRNGNIAITGNCGMCAVQTTLTASDLPDDLKQIRHQIERDVPVGNSKHNADRLPKFIDDLWVKNLLGGLNNISAKYSDILTKDSPCLQLGTLGGGNHFIEICLDEEQNVWIMLHSGSRGIGNRIGTYFIEQARKEMERFFINLPDKDLAYLAEGTELFKDYVNAVEWAQQYAFINRQAMLKNVIAALQHHTKPFELVEEAINCHHNYISKENHFGQNVYVTRKGAVRAREGDLGIIPGSMGACSYIVRGKGNPESFHSCSHGAGRTMSRTKAKQLFSVEDHIKATEGVECRKDKGVIDETPMAYKPIDKVMEAQQDLVEVVAVLKQILCVKG